MENIQATQPSGSTEILSSEKKTGGATALGVALILLGAAAILGRFIPGINALMWAAAFAGGGFGAYVYGKRKSSRLLLGLAYLMALVSVSITVGVLLPGEFLAATINFGIAAPFLYAYSRNRNQWGWLIPGGLFTAAGAIVLLAGIWAILPALFIVGGIYLLVRSSGNKQLSDGSAFEENLGPATGYRPITGPDTQTGPAPTTGPEADK